MRYVLELTFAGPTGSGADWERANAQLAARVEPLLAGVEAVKRGPTSVTAELTPANARRLADAVRRVKAGGQDRFSVAILNETVDPADAGQADWYVVRPAEMFDPEVRSKAGLNSCKADRQKGASHLRRYHDADVYASEAVRAFAAEHGFGGLELVWVKDAGKYRAPQWYHAFAAEPLGRGADHPWFDPETYGRFSRYGANPDSADFQPADPVWRAGVSLFGLHQLRAGAGSADGPELADLLGELRNGLPLDKACSSFVEGPRRVPRASLPAGDGPRFAYAWAHPIQRTDGGGYRYPGYRLCASRAARDLLVGARLATPADFEPVVTLDRLPAGVEPLDAAVAAPLPGPMFAGAGLAKLRAEERAAREKHDAKPRPERPADFKPVLAKLKRAAKRDEAAFRPGAAADALRSAAAATTPPVPKRWAEVLSVSDGFEVDESAAGDGAAVRVAAAGGIPAVHAGCVRAAAAARRDVPGGWIGVADADGGDPIFLDAGRPTGDGDCPVVRVDHETGADGATWPSIAAFVDDLLARDDG